MRQLLLAAAMLVSTAASAQITYETTYVTTGTTQDLSFFKLANGDVKFAKVDVTARQITVYNLNHSVLRSFAIPALPAGNTLSPGVEYMSDKLFNQDANFEYIINSYRQVGNDYVSKSWVFSETGTQLFAADSADIDIFNTPNGAKMVTYHYPLPANNVQKRQVYALAGTLTSVRPAGAVDAAQPFPNPAVGAINLPYQVQRGQQATLEVLDMTGRVVKRFTVDSTFDHLLLQAGELRPGAYTYRVGAVPGKKFVVGR
ncbi:T9SS type A sorting domain-containing protein [Hymenobacter sp. 15J16-1T3B]|uniref:T9SS type A sorting domain-containing protein n=1 Tax=Hymenobacter sp. 15J16-1T3B TaxID=2886941 RepID=UPI001D11CAD5|nr:T9SS type A sorting domain-containing protein [Hymenobacter sp. 15J16-1T3B]MCC3159532.1 T9SS type A sorting domain-containing protein [Hymenobacter sp. 15J16-1T3B]